MFFPRTFQFRFVWPLLFVAFAAAGCRTAPRPGAFAPRLGDEIVVAGKFVHTGTPVILWLDPGGYDAYRVERRFGPVEDSSWSNSTAQVKPLTTPNRYGMRTNGMAQAQIERIRGGGWDLPMLQSKVDQLVIHYDDAGTSRSCFRVLQDDRDLSVHFMLDIDGTIYQTLDLKERARHATTSNDRSVGVEIANVGAFPRGDLRLLKKWYTSNTNGQTTITIPPELGDGGVRTPGFVGHPARPNLISGNIQGRELFQYDYTPQQYDGLVKLTATLCKVFPKLTCRYPTDASGKLVTHKLSGEELAKYSGMLGHYHIQTNKEDPGPAFNWDYVIRGAEKLLHLRITLTGGHGQMQPVIKSGV